MQQQTPEQVENQKIDAKLNELQQKKALADNPDLQSPTDALRAMLLPPRPKVKPDPQMKVLVNQGEVLGEGKVAKGKAGMKAFNPYGSKKTQGLNPHKVIMGQGAGMMGNGNTKMLTKNPKKHHTGGKLGSNEAVPYNSTSLQAHRPHGATNAVAQYQAMMNAKYGLNLVVDGAWGKATQEAYQKYVIPEQNGQVIHKQALALSNNTLPSAIPFNKSVGVQSPQLLPIQKPYIANGLQSAGVTALPKWGVQ